MTVEALGWASRASPLASRCWRGYTAISANQLEQAMADRTPQRNGLRHASPE